VVRYRSKSGSWQYAVTRSASAGFGSSRTSRAVRRAMGRTSGPSDEADAVVDRAQHPLGPLARLVGADRQQAVELGRVLEQLERAGADRREALHHGLGHVLLEVAVA